MDADLYSRVLGCMVGGAIGDAFGAVMEFRNAEKVARYAGGDWVNDLLPFTSEHHALALYVWEECPPRGTATDDTRLNQAFVECVIRNGGLINSQLLAIEYIERYRDRALLYPQHLERAKWQFIKYYNRACAYLGMAVMPDGTPGRVAAARGNAFPSATGLISLAPAGLLYPGEPKEAYLKAFELAYNDVGYARDATAMLAAIVSAGLGGVTSGKEAVRVALETDPLGFGKRRLMADRIRELLAVADEAGGDRALVDALAARVRHLHAFDPIDVLGVPMAGVHFTDGDPVRSIVIACNDRDNNPDGSLARLRDVDCTGGVAGAIVGALKGIEAFPDDWVRDTMAASKQVYGIDFEQNARRFCEVVYGGVE